VKVHDVTVVSCDGKLATGDIVLVDSVGNLVEHRVEYTFDGKAGQIKTNQDVDQETALALLDAIEDFKEACKHRREELKGMN
jgi:hypothetical protein